jgi:hypothetical protein
MRHRLSSAALAVAAAWLAGSPALSEEVVFRFSSTVGGNGTSIPNTAPGDSVEIAVIADNGLEGIAGRVWESRDHVKTEVLVGDGFDLIQSGPVQFHAETDSTGRVIAIDLFKSPGLALGSDGSGGGMALTVNGARNFVIDGVDVIDAEDLTTPENWTIEVRSES